jgi:hypothetical protein
VSHIDDEIDAFKAMQSWLEAEHMGKWVIVHNRQLVQLYETFELAARDAIRQFGSGPFLIRQIGEPPMRLPASVMYHRDARR